MGALVVLKDILGLPLVDAEHSKIRLQTVPEARRMAVAEERVVVEKHDA
jgi:hypothetical protein